MGGIASRCGVYASGIDRRMTRLRVRFLCSFGLAAATFGLMSSMRGGERWPVYVPACADAQSVHREPTWPSLQREPLLWALGNPFPYRPSRDEVLRITGSDQCLSSWVASCYDQTMGGVWSEPRLPAGWPTGPASEPRWLWVDAMSATTLVVLERHEGAMFMLVRVHDGDMVPRCPLLHYREALVAR